MASLSLLIERYVDLTWSASKRFNLIGYRDLETFRKNGVQDCLSSLETAKQALGHLPESVLDVGSGAGLPGLLAAAVFPDARVCLVESSLKKAAFLEETGKALGLGNVEVHTGRIEEFREFEGFELAFCRAVAELAVSLEYTLPFLKSDGIFIAHKGRKLQQELIAAKHAITLFGAEVENTVSFDDKNYLIVRKCRKTPEGFPRRTGVPAKRPVGNGF